jgi:hypothetical protein
MTYQVTFTPPNARNRAFEELIKTEDYQEALKAATDKVSAYFNTEEWKANKEIDAEFIGCEDWFCYDPSNTTKEAAIVAINCLPLTKADPDSLGSILAKQLNAQGAGYVHGVPERT